MVAGSLASTGATYWYLGADPPYVGAKINETWAVLLCSGSPGACRSSVTGKMDTCKGKGGWGARSANTAAFAIAGILCPHGIS